MVEPKNYSKLSAKNSIIKNISTHTYTHIPLLLLLRTHHPYIHLSPNPFPAQHKIGEPNNYSKLFVKNPILNKNHILRTHHTHIHLSPNPFPAQHKIADPKKSSTLFMKIPIIKNV
jgi:hypothetical protein